ncbi:lipopolysaccharide assembly protein LapA domain-containing protein [Thermocrinis sp.]|uniref:lipopolysaccharide assembly protein LapA domain-containing protein n=1 Tax=Thermocrinis sp. TaxID=2024383 RepID=UPI002FDC7EF5
MRIVKLLFALLLIGSFLVFVAQNSILVEVSFFNYRGYTPVFVLVLISALIGFLIAFLYFFPREIKLRGTVDNLREGAKSLNRGFLLKAEHHFQKNSLLEPLLCLSLYEREETSKMLSLKSPLSAYMLLKLHLLEQAEEKFKRTLETDQENLLALKGLRDISFLKGETDRSVEYQERVLKLCEKWDKENQKRVLAELLAFLWRTNKEVETAEKAFDLYRTPLTYSVCIISLFDQEKKKDATKLFEKSFEDNLQNEVLTLLLAEEPTLTKLMDVIQKREQQISKVVLLMIYLRLGLFSKVKSLIDDVPDYYRCLAMLFMSHRDEERTCAKAFNDLLYLWECTCGVRYKEYTPLCPNCLKWNKLELKI